VGEGTVLPEKYNVVVEWGHEERGLVETSAPNRWNDSVGRKGILQVSENTIKYKATRSRCIH
jgi:hypothetical protein